VSEIHAFWFKNINKRDDFGKFNADEMIILNILKKQCMNG
jgi:hypothetical protein